MVSGFAVFVFFTCRGFVYDSSFQVDIYNIFQYYWPYILVLMFLGLLKMKSTWVFVGHGFLEAFFWSIYTHLLHVLLGLDFLILGLFELGSIHTTR